MMVDCLRVYIDLPRSVELRPVISDRDRVANTIVRALAKHGYAPEGDGPRRWGFGVIAKRLRTHCDSKQRFYAVERVIIGSSDPRVVGALSKLTAEDLLEDNAVPGAALDLRAGRLCHFADALDVDAVNLYCISPIRVTEPKRNHPEVLQTGEVFDHHLNMTMATRFGREFKLRLVPDSLYVRNCKGDIVSQMAVKMRPNGKPLTLQGIVLPFTLLGSPRDIRDAFYSGLGRNTARGFGCVEIAQ